MGTLKEGNATAANHSITALQILLAVSLVNVVKLGQFLVRPVIFKLDSANASLSSLAELVTGVRQDWAMCQQAAFPVSVIKLEQFLRYVMRSVEHVNVNRVLLASFVAHAFQIILDILA